MNSDRTGIVIPPPVLFALPFGTGWLLGRVWDWPVLPNRVVAVVLGAVLILIGSAVALAGVRQFRRARTTVLPFGGTTQIVMTGIYRWTRNPMYVGVAIAYAGFAMLANSAWAFVFLPVALGLVYALAIRREEQYLARKFGDSYQRYCAVVPRWI